jgi:hypothetical protein
MTAIEETARDITLKVIEQQAYGPISDDAGEAGRVGAYVVALYRTILEGVRSAHDFDRGARPGGRERGGRTTTRP